jgi:hypothetical protein
MFLGERVLEPDIRNKLSQLKMTEKGYNALTFHYRNHSGGHGTLVGVSPRQ